MAGKVFVRTALAMLGLSANCLPLVSAQDAPVRAAVDVPVDQGDSRTVSRFDEDTRHDSFITAAYAPPSGLYDSGQQP